MPLYAGVCETNITPPPDVWIGGQETIRRCEGVHDDLYARALVLDNGHKRVALIVADLMAGSEEWARGVRQAVADALHTDAGAVMLHCTHTRSGPRLPAVYGPDKHDGATMETLTRKIAGVARQAADNLLPAGLTYGEASAQIGVARHLSGSNGSVLRADNYGGAVSSLVQTLCVVGADGQTFALLFAHACPPDTMTGDNAHITADWPGAAVAHLKKRFQKEAADTGIADDALPFCLIGCGGDIAPVRRGSWDAVQTNGRIIADAAHTARWNAHGRLSETLDWSESTLALPLFPPPSLQAFTIQKLNLGGVILLGFSAEMFTAYQQVFLAMSNTPVFCLNTTNGSLGYIPDEAHAAALNTASGCEALLHTAVRELLPTSEYD